LTYPKYEIYGIVSQIRRASMSIALNIAEGYGRMSNDDFKRFLKISLGSTNETITLINFSRDLNYISENQYNKILNQYRILGKKIYKFIQNM